MLTNKQQQALDKYTDSVYNILTNHHQQQLTECDKAILARMFAQMIYELPKIHSGKASANAVVKKLNDPTWQPSKDHYHTRKAGGMRLMQLLDQDVLTKNEVSNILLQYSQVHYVTSEENTMLRKFQRVNPATAYTDANITLVECEDLFSRRNKTEQWKLTLQSKFKHITERTDNGKV